MPDQIDQRPELLAIAYPSLQLRKEVESAPVLIAELVKARAVRQQLSGAVQDAPPHRFRELFLTGAVSPKLRIMLNDPEPVTQSEIMRIDVTCITPATRQ